MIRVGNAVYARDNKSFGLTTLKTRHVEVEGSKLRFAFKGKSGKEWKLKLVDRRMAKIIRSIQELPGQHLFQYINGGGERRARALAGRQRLYPRGRRRQRLQLEAFPDLGRHGQGAALFAQIPLPDTKAGIARAMNVAIDEVAHHLGNTRPSAAVLHPSRGDGVPGGKAARRRTGRGEAAPQARRASTTRRRWCSLAGIARGVNAAG